MSDQNHTTSNGSNTAMAFILGGVVVAIGVLAWIYYGGDVPVADQPDIRIELPGGGAVEGEVTPGN